MKSPVCIETPRLRLFIPSVELAGRYLAYFERNRDHLARWDPPRPEGFYTEAFWRERLLRDHEDFAADRALRLALQWRGAPGGEVIGVCNFTQFVRGAFQAATLGYSLDQRAVGSGLMFEAIEAGIAYMFDTLGFHRVMANYLPHNERSGRLLRRLGFAVEGYARDYLFIDGAWRDHVLTALTNPRSAPPGGSRTTGTAHPVRGAGPRHG
ncbi:MULTISPECIES: GNAT family N-acetyltransferase [Sorangium]|uniref:GNAT family N-acetyltransferase n=1 Tax=Sorangium atrum TaxID=2995308 RepID=A0ABT5C254_9BACT|nr:GNAT family N-acetyltransferase [Sorangium aterium]MDC0680492.1 GNAT family N-acetyltransferase [Sorangium aterium]